MTPAEEKTEEKLFPWRLKWLVDKASQSCTHSCTLSHSCGSREFWEFPLPISSGRGDWDDKHCVTCCPLKQTGALSHRQNGKRSEPEVRGKKKRQSRFSAQAGRPTAELMKISPLVLLPTSLKHPPVDPPLKIQSFKHFQQNIKYIHSEPLISLLKWRRRAGKHDTVAAEVVFRA